MTNQFNLSVSEKESDPEWDAFVASVPYGHHVQTSLWGQVKATYGYHAKRIIAWENGRIVAGGQVLVKQMLPFASVGFMPKGPLYEAGSTCLKETILDELKRVVIKDHLQVLAVQPVRADSELETLIQQRGFRSSWLELASTATILIDLSQAPDKILGQMKRQTRQNIRRSEREGITCREGNENDLTNFYRFHLATSKRQGFSPYPEKYYQKMWQVFKPCGYIHLIISEFNNEATSMLLLFPFNDTVVAKVLGWSGQYPEKRPNDAVFWASILWAKSHGYHYFDLEGINRTSASNILQGIPLDEEMKDSYTFFKLGYGGQVVLFPQAYDYVNHPFMRWSYQKIFSAHGQSTNTYERLDRFRRRFG
jgi:peptidoglycan pentaglycine glycine transferase (the first glycine)